MSMKALASAMLLEVTPAILIEVDCIVCWGGKSIGEVGKLIVLEIKSECGICVISLSIFNQKVNDFYPAIKWTQCNRIKLIVWRLSGAVFVVVGCLCRDSTADQHFSIMCERMNEI
jgi:hypothetical protein